MFAYQSASTPGNYPVNNSHPFVGYRYQTSNGDSNSP